MSPFITRPLPSHIVSVSGSSSLSQDGDPISETVLIASRRPRRFFWIGLTILFSVGFFLFGGIYAAFFSTPFSGGQTTDQQTSLFDFSAQLGDLFSAKSSTQIQHILLMGVGGEAHNGGNLTDTLIIARIDPVKQAISMISIPRDLYVAVGKNSGSKINSLSAIGEKQGVGYALTIEKIEEIMGVHIDHSIAIDFAGFRQAVDVLGGVEIDVPETLVDREYPNESWGYTTLIVKKGPQTLNGKTALAYARSRHSTSDFSRSARQQLLIKAIKQKVLSEGVYSPTQLMGLYDTVKSNLTTDMSVAQMLSLALVAKEIPSDRIFMSTLSNACAGINSCQGGSFLYNPSMDLFGGASVLLPENAQLSRLSYYDDIQRFANLTFSYPDRGVGHPVIRIITTKKQKSIAQGLTLSLAKLGYDMSSESIYTTTGAITSTRISYYWHPDLQTGYRSESDTIQSLHSLFPSVSWLAVTKNEYIQDEGPVIEIIIGDDSMKYLRFVKTPHYLPTTSSGQKSSKSSVTGALDSSSGSSSRSASGATKSPKKEVSNSQNPNVLPPDPSPARETTPSPSSESIAPKEILPVVTPDPIVPQENPPASEGDGFSHDQ